MTTCIAYHQKKPNSSSTTATPTRTTGIRSSCSPRPPTSIPTRSRKRAWVTLACATSFFFFASGCAFRDGWTRADVTESQRKADLYACERDMHMTDAGARFFRQCMQARGYTQQ